MKKILLFLAIACISLPQIAFSGAWTLPEKDIWAEFSTKANWAKDDYDGACDEHRKTRNARSWGWSMNGKAEYGVLDWITLLAGVEYKESKYKEYTRNNKPGERWGTYSVKNHGLTMAEVGVRVNFLREPLVVSAQAKGLFTLQEIHKQLENVSEAPSLGDRTNAYELRVLISQKYDNVLPLPFYFGIESGYRFNVHNIYDHIPLFGEIGFWPTNWLLIKTEIDSMFAASRDTKDRMRKEYAIWRIGPVFHLLGNTDVTRDSASLNLEFQYGYTFWGRNSSADQEVIGKLSGQY